MGGRSGASVTSVSKGLEAQRSQEILENKK